MKYDDLKALPPLTYGVVVNYGRLQELIADYVKLRGALGDLLGPYDLTDGTARQQYDMAIAKAREILKETE